jgi:hypothetical protein
MNIRSMVALGGVAWPISTTCAWLFLAVTVLESPAAAQTAQQAGVRAIRLVQQDKTEMTVYSVTLDRRFDMAELDGVSKRIKRAAPPSKVILISFFLRGMAPDREAWATSAFNPNLDTFVIRVNEVTTRTNLPEPDLRIAAGE